MEKSMQTNKLFRILALSLKARIKWHRAENIEALLLLLMDLWLRYSGPFNDYFLNPKGLLNIFNVANTTIKISMKFNEETDR